MMIHGARPAVQFGGVRQVRTFEYDGQTFEVDGRHARRLGELEAAARSYEADDDPPILFPNPASELADYQATLARKAGYQPAASTTPDFGDDPIIMV